MKLLVKLIICFGALAVTAYAFPAQVTAEGGVWTLIAAAAILWLLNLIVKPLLHALCLPVTLVTAGLFFFVVNAWMVSLADAILPGLHIEGFWLKLLAAFLVSVGNAALLSARKARM
ncbi:MAG TPA: phage holin family protein [Feifaniaceae bacterium]|nr:phage holin family protein [Feifaniaceae bacterium]